MLKMGQKACVLATLGLGVASGAVLAQSPTLGELRAGFLHPPDAAKPMVRWWWFGTAVEKPEILRELEQMKADGIGGAELAFVYPEVLDDPAKGLVNLPFVSPPMLDAVNYAQTEGRKLGLRIDVTLGSGWPYGGAATTLAEAAGRLRTAEVPVAPGATSVAAPKLAEGETLISAALVKGTPTPPPSRGHLAVPGAPTWSAASAEPLAMGGGQVKAAEEARVALFFIQSHTGQEVKRAAVGAEGWVLDPFSHDAVATHLKSVGEPLVKAFGSTPPYAIFSDSLEAYGADWTPNLLTEFQKRRGYDLKPHLPELVGGGSTAADTIRHDYGRTLTELVDENYLLQINDWAKAHGTKFRSQTYGEPAVSFSSQRLVDLAEGEGPQWRAFSTLRWATSGNHVFGNPVTSGETFTWLHSPVFRATPLDMKAEADIDFIMGENQLIFHGWPYSPPRLADGQPKVPEPGWSLYAAASFNNHNPWHPLMPAVDAYIARISYLLRQGQPANQVAILLPTDDAWASFTPSHVTVTGAMQRMITPALMSAILSAGFNVDYIDADAIDRVGFGTHQVLVIPPADRMPVETVRKINAWVSQGGRAVALRRMPSLDPEGKPLAVKLSDRNPVVADEDALGQGLPDAAKPDLQWNNADGETRQAVGFVRRRLTDADVYVVVNTSNKPVHGQAAFATSFAAGAMWDPETGEVAKAGGAVQPKGMTVDLPPYGSAVYVFGKGVESAPGVQHASTQVADLSRDWKVRFVGLGKSEQEPTLTDWTADAATAHYSGEAVYARDFEMKRAPGSGSFYLQVEGGTPLPGAPNSPQEHAVLGANGLPNPLITRPGPGMHAYFDPPIHEAALVVVNGQPAGALWHPPYRVEVGQLLKPGVNHVEIHVYNTALNAWSAEPPHDYKPLIEKYGDRFQMQDLDKVKPVPSGLLGTVTLYQGGQ